MLNVGGQPAGRPRPRAAVVSRLEGFDRQVRALLDRNPQASSRAYGAPTRPQLRGGFGSDPTCARCGRDARTTMDLGLYKLSAIPRRSRCAVAQRAGELEGHTEDGFSGRPSDFTVAAVGSRRQLRRSENHIHVRSFAMPLRPWRLCGSSLRWCDGSASICVICGQYAMARWMLRWVYLRFHCAMASVSICVICGLPRRCLGAMASAMSNPLA